MYYSLANVMLLNGHAVMGEKVGRGLTLKLKKLVIQDTKTSQHG
jgi:hypothetical protein